MEQIEELDWIDRIKRGETEHFTKLYSKYNRTLYAICYRFTGNDADAEEQLQEVFLKLIVKIGSYRKESSFKTWLTRLTINHMINFQNSKEGRYNDDEKHVNVILDDLASIQQIDPIDQIEMSMALTQAILSLPNGFKQVFLMHDQAGLSHREISEILNISTATSRSQLSRARFALRNLLRESLEVIEL